MYKRPCDRVEDTGDGEDDRGKIQGHGKGKVQTDRRHHPAGEPEQMGEFPDVIVYKDDICGVYCDVAADPAHGDADAGFFQCGSVIDTVADHTDGLFLLFPGTDPVQFILRQTVGVNLADMELPGNMSGSIFMVAGEQDRDCPGGFQRIDRIGGVLPERVGECDESGCLQTDREVDDRTAFCKKYVRT